MMPDPDDRITRQPVRLPEPGELPPIHFLCSGCYSGMQHTVPGEKVRCGACGKWTTVPEEGLKGPEAILYARYEMAWRDAARQRRASWKLMIWSVAVAMGIGVLTLIVGVIVALVTGGR